MIILLIPVHANGIDQIENVEEIDSIEIRFKKISLSQLDPIYCEVRENHLVVKIKMDLNYKSDRNIEIYIIHHRIYSLHQ